MQQMNSIVMQDGSVRLKQVEIPKPARGQVLVRSLACGICGSDLHITRHADEVFDVFHQLGLMPDEVGEHAQVMLGHEFCAEIVEYGADTQQTLPVGSRVTSVPMLLSQNGAGVGVTPVLMALTLSTSCLMKRYCYLSQTECRLRRRH